MSTSLLDARAPSAIHFKRAILGHQIPALGSASRFKLLRWGRRGGKSRLAVIAGVTGHGPDREDGTPRWRGIVQGGKIGWFVRDIPQGEEVWNEVIVPRFAGVPGMKLLDTKKLLIWLPTGGTLKLYTNENINSARGRALTGAIFDEAAHFDLEYAWTKVVRPTLVDQLGWVIFASTTNAGQDGNKPHVAPSYFNRLCAMSAKGELDDDWEEFYMPSEGNPLLDRRELQKICRELGGPTSPTWQQEYQALLITGGAGLAFPEFKPLAREAIHVVPNRTQFPSNWEWAASLDWGYNQGSYGLWGIDADGNVERVWEYYETFTHLHARQAALNIFAASAHLPRPGALAYDGQMDAENGVKAGVTLHQEWDAGMRQAFGGRLEECPIMTPTVKGDGSRVTKKNLMHSYLAYADEYGENEAGERKSLSRDPRTGYLLPWCRPRLRVNERCTGFIREMQSLPLDEHRPEDVDTNARDHAYDDACMLLSARIQPPERAPDPIDQNISRIEAGQPRRPRWETLASEMADEAKRRSWNTGYEFPHTREEVDV